MGRSRDLDDKPTRKRPLQIQVTDSELVIVLVGPHASMRDRLFRRLGKNPDRSTDDPRFKAANFDLGGVTIDLIDWLASPDPTEALAALGKASYALCIDPKDRHCDEAFDYFVEPLREGLFSNACIALISDGEHLNAAHEQNWQQRLKEAGVNCRVYRINCGDTLSPELFAKLFLAGVRDGGDDDHGLVVKEIRH